jgi:cysteine desulfurase
VPGIVGLGEACALAAEDMTAEAIRVGALRDRLLQRLAAAVPGIHINGGMVHRLPGNLNLSIDGVDGDALLTSIPDIAVSAGSACSGAESSYVLAALGLPISRLRCTLRFGIGRCNTEAEIDYAAAKVASEVNELRTLSPVL